MTKDLSEGKIFSVRYHSISNDETTFRTIIPTYVPSENIKGIDVTDLSHDQQEQLRQMVEEYNEYVKAHNATAFDFVTWAEHAKNMHVVPKFRTFKPSNIKVID